MSLTIRFEDDELKTIKHACDTLEEYQQHRQNMPLNENQIHTLLNLAAYFHVKIANAEYELAHPI